MPKRYRSDALAAVHEIAQGLAEAGAMDKRRLRGFDALCLTPVEPFSAAEIRALRLRENASQAEQNRGRHRPISYQGS
jgi:putative transcriptional regulator